MQTTAIKGEQQQQLVRGIPLTRADFTAGEPRALTEFIRGTSSVR